MAICTICDDTGVISSDTTEPAFCYCSAGRKAKRQWEAQDTAYSAERPASFIDIADLEQVNANVDAMRASLLGSVSAVEGTTTTKLAAVQLLYRVAHPGHEISMAEATQLHDLARLVEGFFGDLSRVGRRNS
ncbi:MAG TPA: hypothetical protein VL461_04385 [Dictyobacter sp.]|jgi:hypothetical protein|nr:hypothetical protein [Dictyobacter sp.]